MHIRDILVSLALSAVRVMCRPNEHFFRLTVRNNTTANKYGIYAADKIIAN